MKASSLGFWGKVVYRIQLISFCLWDLVCEYLRRVGTTFFALQRGWFGVCVWVDVKDVDDIVDAIQSQL